MKFQELHNNEFQALHDITKFTLYYIKTYEHQEPLDTAATARLNAHPDGLVENFVWSNQTTGDCGDTCQIICLPDS
jgi:hypothetical protein